MPHLFSPFRLKDVELRNRIAVPPMCQYSAVEGVPNDWHRTHYSQLARGGAGLVVVEATGVSADGRITPGCTGIWNDQQAAAFTEIRQDIEKSGSVPGIQIAHAGMKASARRPWEGGAHIPADDNDAWPTIAPSAVAFGTEPLSRVPRAMTLDDIARVKGDFVSAARRSADAGFRWLELHFAHGYLGQSFLSVHTNHRRDPYGGSLENRGRFLLETLQAVREAWPENLPLTARLGVIEFDGRDQETIFESIEVVKRLKEAGLDFLSVSIGFSTPKAEIPWGPALLAPFSKQIRNEVGIPVGSAWGFDTPSLADAAIRNQDLDLVFVGRAHLANPHWSYQAALGLRIEKPEQFLPQQYRYWLEQYHLKRG